MKTLRNTLLAVLLLLCAYFAVTTFHLEYPAGGEGGAALAASLQRETACGAAVVLVATDDEQGRAFAEAYSSTYGLTSLSRNAATESRKASWSWS